MAIAQSITPNRRHHATLPSPSERFAPYWLLVGIASAALFALWLLYPRTYIENALQAQDKPNVATLAYLRLLVRAKPDDTGNRLLLARQALIAQELPWVRTALAPWMGRPLDTLPLDIARLRLRLLQQEWTGQPEGSPARSVLARTYTRALLGLAPRMNPAQLLDEAHFALALGAYPTVAELDRQVLLRSQNAALRQDAFEQGIAALLAAGKAQGALDFAHDALPYVRHDDALWRRMIRLALASGRPVLAARYARRLVRMPGPA